MSHYDDPGPSSTPVLIPCSTCDSLRGKVICAELAVTDLRAKLQAAEAQVVSHLNRIAELESYSHGLAETQDRLQAEVARLTKAHDVCGYLVSEIQRTATEAALRWVINHSNEFVDDSVSNDELIERGIKELLGEGWDA